MHCLLCVGGRRQLIEGVVGSALVVIDQPPVRDLAYYIERLGQAFSTSSR
jgi:hypothetical protein